MKKQKKYCPYIVRTFISEDVRQKFDENGNLVHNTFIQIKNPAFAECRGKEYGAFALGRCRYKK